MESLAGVTEDDNKEAEKLVQAGKIKVKLNGISSDIFIEATVKTTEDICVVTIKHSHTNIVKIILNEKVIFENKKISKENSEEDIHLILKYTLAEILNYIKNMDIKEIEFIKKAFEMNMELFNEGLHSKKSTFIHQLFKMNGEKIFSDDVLKTAQLLCNGAIESRVI